MRRTNPKFYDIEHDLVQCQFCKKWFKGLMSHIPRIHNITCEEYKEEFSLWNGDLVSVGTRLKFSEYHKKPEVLEKSTHRFFKNIQPYNHKNKKGGVKNERYLKIKGIDWHKYINYTNLSKTLKKAHAEGKFDICYKKRRKGINKKCLNCDKEFYVQRCHIKTAKFCSRECKDSSSYIKKQN